MSAPLLDEHLGLALPGEEFPVKQRVSQLTVEALVLAVLPGTAGFDEERLNL